ncbi:MAG: transcriptional regulator NrdR [Dehalococcoidia bacterium]|nr:transcriptional regulator NrdR [Dehalococcoidia bacterium]MDD5494796.1 transcriptional regulator NrdR [Dehalococcoidia bacterium]
MKCPSCGEPESKVIDSRSLGDEIRRRRECEKCRSRFTTYERLENRNLYVIKKDGRREEFSREKLFSGIRKACEKRPLPMGAIDKLVENIEVELYSHGKAEIPTTVIGKIVIDKLADIDHIAYIRFASVYYEFSDISTLKQAVDNLVDSRTGAPLDGQLPLISAEDIISPKRRNRQRR